MAACNADQHRMDSKLQLFVKSFVVMAEQWPQLLWHAFF
jgi:hypothetical protein